MITNSITKESIDCMLLPFGTQNYLLPIVAVAELGALSGVEYEFNQEMHYGSLLWRGLLLPLVSPNQQTELKELIFPKYVIINALYADTSRVPFFALVVEQRPVRLKLIPEELSWIDKQSQRALISKQNKEVILLDLFALSKLVESQIQLKSPNKP